MSSNVRHVSEEAEEDSLALKRPKLGSDTDKVVGEGWAEVGGASGGGEVGENSEEEVGVVREEAMIGTKSQNEQEDEGNTDKNRAKPTNKRKPASRTFFGK